MAAQRLGKRVLSKLQAPSRARGPGGSPGGLQKRHARVTVKYDRRELQRRLDVEKWIDGRLEELYRGRVRRGEGLGMRGGGSGLGGPYAPRVPGMTVAAVRYEGTPTSFSLANCAWDTLLVPRAHLRVQSFLQGRGR